jgi:hypothetical protein
MYSSREERSIVITLNPCDFKRAAPRFSGIHWDLVEDVSVTAVQRLACAIGAGGVVRALLDGVKSAGSGGD